MAWTKTSEGNAGDKPYAVYEENIRTSQLSLAAAGWSAEIDFIPPGTDYALLASGHICGGPETMREKFLKYSLNLAETNVLRLNSCGNY